MGFYFIPPITPSYHRMSAIETRIFLFNSFISLKSKSKKVFDSILFLTFFTYFKNLKLSYANSFKASQHIFFFFLYLDIWSTQFYLKTCRTNLIRTFIKRPFNTYQAKLVIVFWSQVLGFDLLISLFIESETDEKQTNEIQNEKQTNKIQKLRRNLKYKRDTETGT